MSKLLNTSICLTDLMEKAKEGHSAFSRSEKNKKVYVNLLQWINDRPDDYGNISSLQLNSKEEKREQEGKVYIGNSKEIKLKEPEPLKAGEIETVEDDDLPF